MRTFFVLSSSLLLAVGCSDETKTATIGGTVSGLQGDGLVLQNKGGDALLVKADGSFELETPVNAGDSYDVTVANQPTSPAQTCTVTGGSGTSTGEAVTTIAVSCATSTYSLGGTVAGLSGTGLVLQNNAGDDLAVSANGSFTFSTELTTGAPFAVTVKTQPSGPKQSCSVAGGGGAIGSADVTTVVVNCNTDRYTIGGNVTGLQGYAVLQNNAGQTIAVAANGTFAFPTPLLSGSTYDVTVMTQPGSPSQSCDVTNGSGTVGSTPVTTVQVACTTNTYSVGGMVTGLVGTGLVLQNNAGDDYTVAADGSFTFTTEVASGMPFDVTVLTQPSGPPQTCTVTGGSGTVGAGDIASVSVNCATNRYSIGGTVAGLNGGGFILKNGNETLPITANGSFSFPTTVASGGTYGVTLVQNPAFPAQTCTVSGGSGPVTNAPITSVIVSCTTNKYFIRGSITGLAANEQVVLQNNGGGNLTVSANGAFVFATQIASGQPYLVSVLTNPALKRCTVANGGGTVAGGDVANITVTCLGQITKWSEGTAAWPDQACNPTNSFGNCDTNAQNHADAWATKVCQNNGYTSGVWTGNKAPGCTGPISMYCQGVIPCEPAVETTCFASDQTKVEITCFQ